MIVTDQTARTQASSVTDLVNGEGIAGKRRQNSHKASLSQLILLLLQLLFLLSALRSEQFGSLAP